jgi:hypothetical protein
MFTKDPETLHLRLNLLEKLIKLTPFFRIDPHEMRDMIQLSLDKKRPNDDVRSHA